MRTNKSTEASRISITEETIVTFGKSTTINGEVGKNVKIKLNPGIKVIIEEEGITLENTVSNEVHEYTHLGMGKYILSDVSPLAGEAITIE